MRRVVLVSGRGTEDPWGAVLRRARSLDLEAILDLEATGLGGVEELLSQQPETAIAARAPGPLAAARLAELLAEHPGPSLLTCPLARVPEAGDLQLTHGWLSTRGLPALVGALLDTPMQIVKVEARGLPEGRTDDLAAVLYHALTVALRIGGRAHVVGATLPQEDQVEVALRSGGVPFTVVASTRGHGLDVHVQTAAEVLHWSVDEAGESLRRAAGEPRVLPLAPWAERTLAQLERPLEGADRAAARIVHGLVDAVEAALGRRLPPAASRLRAPADAEGLARFGLAGELPEPTRAPIAPSPAPPLPGYPEVLAYRYGVVDAFTLSVPMRDAPALEAQLAGAFVARSSRGAAALPADRTLPDPHATFRVARTADGLAALVTALDREEVDAREVGGVLGYPSCCVDAYVARIPTDDGTYRTCARVARTAAGPGPWPAVLDDSSLTLLPYEPCTYRCEASRRRADRILDGLLEEHPDAARAVAAHLGGPVLYIDEAHHLRLEGEVVEGAVRYGRVRVGAAMDPLFEELAAAIAGGDRLVLGEGTLTVYRGDDLHVSLTRVDPALGVILPFAPVIV